MGEAECTGWLFLPAAPLWTVCLLPSFILQTRKRGQPWEGSHPAQAESHPGCEPGAVLTRGSWRTPVHPFISQRKTPRHTLQGPLSLFQNIPSKGQCSPGTASLSCWKSQLGSWCLGKGRALKINCWPQPWSSWRSPVSRSRRLALPADDSGPGWSAPASVSWPLGWAGDRWQPGIFDPLLPRHSLPPHTRTCTHMPQPGMCSAERGWAAPEEGAGGRHLGRLESPSPCWTVRGLGTGKAAAVALSVCPPGGGGPAGLGVW